MVFTFPVVHIISLPFLSPPGIKNYMVSWYFMVLITFNISVSLVELFIFNKILTPESMVWAFVCNDEVIWINIIHRSQSEWMDQRQILFNYIHDGTRNLQFSISSAHLVESLMHLNFLFICCDNLSHNLSSIFIGPLRKHTVDFVKPFFIRVYSVPPTN